jgi:hypothetical protein
MEDGRPRAVLERAPSTVGDARPPSSPEVSQRLEARCDTKIKRNVKAAELALLLMV